MRRLLVAALMLVGCAHRGASVAAPGREQRPYTGKPSYLDDERRREAELRHELDDEPVPAYSERQPVVGHRELPSGERAARLRALLAAVDAHAYSIGVGPGLADVRALELTVDELGALMAPYPDIAYEVSELRDLARDLPSVPPARLARVRARIGQLTDLIRLQLVAGT